MFLPPAKRSLGQDNVFTGVCLSTRGIGFPACVTGHMTRGVCIQGGSTFRRGLPPGGLPLGWEVCIGGGAASRGGGILRDTVNKWAVRILLQCILLYSIGSFISTDGHVSHDIDLECVLKIWIQSTYPYENGCSKCWHKAQEEHQQTKMKLKRSSLKHSNCNVCSTFLFHL